MLVGGGGSYGVSTKKGFWIPQTCIQNYFALLSLDENSENCDMISQKRDSVKQFIHKVLHRLQQSPPTDSAGEKSKNKHGSWMDQPLVSAHWLEIWTASKSGEKLLAQRRWMASLLWWIYRTRESHRYGNLKDNTDLQYDALQKTISNTGKTRCH